VKPCFFSVGCKFKALTPWFQSSVDTAAHLIVPSKQWKMKGWGNPLPIRSLNLWCSLSWWITFQVTGIFRGGFTTLLRESIGSAVFFSVYEYVRYYMHLQLKPTLSDHSNLTDMGIGIVTGGLSGVAVSTLITCTSWKKLFNVLHEVIWLSFSFWCYPVLVCCFALGCGENYHPDSSR
jgi:hypothetical protein